MTTENGARVTHPIHGEGVIGTRSPCGQYAVVRYPAGYHRTHRIADLTRVTSPAATICEREYGGRHYFAIDGTCQRCGHPSIPPGQPT